jgi:hypothetical protein
MSLSSWVNKIERAMSTAGYEIFKSLFRHWICERFPAPSGALQQDNIHVLLFERGERWLKLIMNLNDLSERKLQAAVITERVELDGDLLDAGFREKLAPLLEPFRPVATLYDSQ